MKTITASRWIELRDDHRYNFQYNFIIPIAVDAASSLARLTAKLHFSIRREYHLGIRWMECDFVKPILKHFWLDPIDRNESRAGEISANSFKSTIFSLRRVKGIQMLQTIANNMKLFMQCTWLHRRQMKELIISTDLICKFQILIYLVQSVTQQ